MRLSKIACFVVCLCVAPNVVFAQDDTPKEKPAPEEPKVKATSIETQAEARAKYCADEKNATSPICAPVKGK